MIAASVACRALAICACSGVGLSSPLPVSRRMKNARSANSSAVALVLVRFGPWKRSCSSAPGGDVQEDTRADKDERCHQGRDCNGAPFAEDDQVGQKETGNTLVTIARPRLRQPGRLGP